MRALALRLATALAVAGVLACGEKPSAPAPRAEPAPLVTPPAQPDAVATATTARVPAIPAPAPAAKPAAAPRAAPVAKPAPTPAPAQEAKPAPQAPSEPVPKPAAEPPAAPAAKAGADKCKMCHRVQHQSWAASAHAKKGLDCEACHGNGGDYWPASVMRDRAKAVAAGLVEQTPDRCRRCHAKADASLLPKAHAHKAR
jgi:hypothetical protein